MITKNVKLYLGDGFPVRIPVSQYDTMWRFVFSIINGSVEWEIPSGATAILNGRKPDGNVFAFAGTIENNTVTVDADVQMTAVAGQTVCELSILADSKTIGTANFILDVEEAPKSADDVVSDTVLDGYGMMVTNAVDDYIERHPEVFGGDKFTTSAKNALLALLEKVAYIDENGQTYIDALESELFPPASIVSITAVFNQGQNVIYDTDSLDVLKQYLTVTVNYDDGTTETVTTYVLSGTLTEGASTITVAYGGKTTTFNVTVSPNGFYYTPSNGLLSAQDFIETRSTSTLSLTEEISNNSLHIVVPQNKSGYKILDFLPKTFTNFGYLKFKIKFVQSGYNQASTTNSNGTPAFRISNGTEGANVGFAKYNGLPGDLKIRCFVGNTATWGSSITMNEWHTIELEYTNGKQSVKVDGVSELSNANPSTTYTTGNLLMMNSSPSSVTEFYIDEIEYRGD